MGNSETENKGYVRIVGDTREGVSVEFNSVNAVVLLNLLANIVLEVKNVLSSSYGVSNKLDCGLLLRVAVDAGLSFDGADDSDDKETED